MNLLSKLTMVVGFVALLGIPGMAQNQGGLPGTEHTQALEAFRQADRVVVFDDIVHYSFDLVVGPGEFDRIRIHRVVKETQPYRPAKIMEGVLLLPGNGNLFEAMFLWSNAPPEQAARGSIAVFLANNNIDVWGMDYGWSFIPPGNKDFSSLKGWGMKRDAEHAEIALSIARWMRATSGQGVGSIHLLGYASGGSLAYAIAGEDSQRPGNLKDVKGIIAIESASLKVLQGSVDQIKACSQLPNIQAGLGSIFATEVFSIFRTLGLAALNAPNQQSAILPAFSNYNAAQVFLILTGFFSGSFKAPDVWLNYADPSRLILLTSSVPVYVPYRQAYDLNASLCESDEYPTTIDDHLGEVTVPIFYLSRTDGALYTAAQTASADIEALILTSPKPAYGLGDLLLANNAADYVWQPVLNWILAHR